MSLIDMVRKQYEYENMNLILEATLNTKYIHSRENLNCKIYFDERSPKTGAQHDARIKITPVTSSNTRNSYTIRLSDMEIIDAANPDTHQGRHEAELVRDFLSKSAIREALYNTIYARDKCGMSIDELFDALKPMIKIGNHLVRTIIIKI